MHGCVLLTFFFYRLCVNSKIWTVFSRAFLDRWLEETNNFALRVGEMTMTLDDITCLLHLTFQGRLMDHTTLTKVNSVNMIGFVLRMLHSTGHPARLTTFVRKTFNTMSRSNPSLNYWLWYHCWITRGQPEDHPYWTQNNYTSELNIILLPKWDNLHLGLWAFSFIKYSISTF
jgi:hypothetical protein